MGLPPIKLSNFVGTQKDRFSIENYIRSIDRDLRNVFDYLRNFPSVYSQATEPKLANGEMAIWNDTGAGKMYLVKDIAGTQKKVELV